MREINVINDLAPETEVSNLIPQIDEGAVMKIPEEIKEKMDYHKKRLRNYVYMKDTFDALEVAFNTGKNLVLFGPGGYGVHLTFL